jgi:glycosyltransferase involved in cell wall biosynthesis
MRYVWDLQAVYFPRERYPWPLSALVHAQCARLRRWDTESSARPFALFANSAAVAARITRHWGRSAEVIHPPVDLSRFRPGGARRGDYLLAAGALVPYKRVDLALEACRRLGRRLIVAGTGPLERELRRNAGPAVEFRGWVSDDEMACLLANAAALLFPGEEDFGILPVEAMASGCPVVALGRGGVLETVGRGASPAALEELAREGVVRVAGGVLFRDQSVEGLCAAIRRLGDAAPDAAALVGLAEPFSAPRFDAQFMHAFDRARTSHATGRSRRGGSSPSSGPGSADRTRTTSA